VTSETTLQTMYETTLGTMHDVVPGTMYDTTVRTMSQTTWGVIPQVGESVRPGRAQVPVLQQLIPENALQRYPTTL